MVMAIRLLLIFFLIPHFAYALSEGELACFDKVDAKDFVPEVRDVRVRINRRFKADRFWKYERKARSSRHRLVVFIDPSMRPTCIEGNYGWARKNVCVLQDESQLPWAILAAQGFDVEDHWTFVTAIKCLRKDSRKKGFRELSFNPRTSLY